MHQPSHPLWCHSISPLIREASNTPNPNQHHHPPHHKKTNNHCTRYPATRLSHFTSYHMSKFETHPSLATNCCTHTNQSRSNTKMPLNLPKAPKPSSHASIVAMSTVALACQLHSVYFSLSWCVCLGVPPFSSFSFILSPSFFPRCLKQLMPWIQWLNTENRGTLVTRVDHVYKKSDIARRVSSNTFTRN